MNNNLRSALWHQRVPVKNLGATSGDLIIR